MKNLRKSITKAGTVLRLSIAKMQRLFVTRFTDITSRVTNVKVVAIAKNEGAYLPEWIYHHLYFGFDALEIHYNRCSDNTVALVNYFETNSKVKFINADAIFSKHTNPQSYVYKAALKKSRKEGFSHVLFIDIDEFWTPLDLESSIKDCVTSAPNHDVMNFTWINKYELDPAFSRALCEKTQFVNAVQVKSMLKTYVFPVVLNPHNVVEKALTYITSSGAASKFTNSNFSRLDDNEFSNQLQPYVVIHRMIRSQIEYIALLAKGRPHAQSSHQIAMKNNRAGIPNESDVEELAFPPIAFQNYQRYINEKLDCSELGRLTNESQSFVLKSYDKVVKMIASAPPDAAPLIEKSLRNVTLQDIDVALQQFYKRAKF